MSDKTPVMTTLTAADREVAADALDRINGLAGLDATTYREVEDAVATSIAAAREKAEQEATS